MSALVVAVLAALLGLGAAGTARAQDAEADVFVARAVVEYDQKRFEAALADLREALALDPNHVDALYYTGLTLAAMGRLDEAVAPLEKARGRAPKDEAILFQLGTVHFAREKYDLAQPLLEEVFALKPRLDTLGYYVGFLRYRRHDYTGALRAFRQGVSQDPKVQQLTLFYSGMALKALGLPERAAAEIDQALRQFPASPLTGPAERVRESMVGARASESRFRAEVRVGAFHDDNVPIIPLPSRESGIQEIRGQRRESFGEFGALRLDYSFLRMGSLDLSATYSFFGSHNNELPRFDLVNHLGGLTAAYRTTVYELPSYLTFQYSWDFSTLGGRDYVQRHIGGAYLSLVESPTNFSTLQLRYQNREFLNEDHVLGVERRSGPNYMVGFAHLFRFEQDRHLLRLGYQRDFDDTRGRDWTYLGHRVVAGAQYTTPWAGVRLNYDFDVHLRDYRFRNAVAPQDAPNTRARVDTEFNHVLAVTVPLPYRLALVGQYQHTDARSNLDLYRYVRNVVSLYAVWTY